MAFGEYLKNMLKQKGISAAELSRRTGIPKTTLSGMFKLDVNKIDINKYILICDALGCEPDQFFREYQKKAAFTVQPLPLSEDEQELVDLYRTLNSDGRTAALAAVKGFASLDQYRKKSETVSEVS